MTHFNITVNNNIKKQTQTMLYLFKKDTETVSVLLKRYSEKSV